MRSEPADDYQWDDIKNMHAACKAAHVAAGTPSHFEFGTPKFGFMLRGKS
jgi:hypothetical protein